LKFIQHLSPGEHLPLGYGIAWRTEWAYGQIVCMPVLFNVLARVLRDAWCYVATIHRDIPVNPRASYLQGRADGRMETFDNMASMGVELGRREDAS